MNVDDIVLVVAIVLNAASYAYCFISWQRDSKSIGMEQLAVSLIERMIACFLMVTVPGLLVYARIHR